eukprot:701387-Rhodomonas_salina.1
MSASLSSCASLLEHCEWPPAGPSNSCHSQYKPGSVPRQQYQHKHPRYKTRDSQYKADPTKASPVQNSGQRGHSTGAQRAYEAEKAGTESCARYYGNAETARSRVGKLVLEVRRSVGKLVLGST